VGHIGLSNLTDYASLHRAVAKRSGSLKFFSREELDIPPQLSKKLAGLWTAIDRLIKLKPNSSHDYFEEDLLRNAATQLLHARFDLGLNKATEINDDDDVSIPPNIKQLNQLALAA
jgi:hypothetical protein